MEGQMKPTFQDLVCQFHVGTGQKADANLRISLIKEEAEEFLEAAEDEDIIAAIDALCDLLYVVYGTADVYGLRISERLQVSVVKDVNWDLVRQDLPVFKSALDSTLKIIEIFEQFNAKGKLEQALENMAAEAWCMAGHLGVKLAPFFLEVHRTNMHKLTGPKREDGKQLKPPGWKPPRIRELYDRMQAGKLPVCTCIGTNQLNHPNGGKYCASCSGLNVEVEQ
jgi:predicted HAD superfamily Cof-like phosphohydrolase